MQAWLNLRYTDDKRAALFTEGLRRHGFKINHGIPKGAADLFVTWNIIGRANDAVRAVKKAGGLVLVAENASWGNDFAGRRWFHIARNQHNTAKQNPIFDDTRWQKIGHELGDWRNHGEVIILPSRGIGPPNLRMPGGFAKQMQQKFGGRVRTHPGKRQAIPLEKDLARAGRVITWGSGAAIKALMMGIPAKSYLQNWIGEQDNTDEGRIKMLTELACHQFEHSEIENGFFYEALKVV